MEIIILTKNFYFKKAIEEVLKYSTFKRLLSKCDCNGKLVIIDTNFPDDIKRLYNIYPICLIIFMVLDDKFYHKINNIASQIPVFYLRFDSSLDFIKIFINDAISNLINKKICSRMYDSIEKLIMPLSLNEEVILLLTVYGFQTDEISDMTGINIKTVYSLKLSAQNKLNIKMKSVHAFKSTSFILKFITFMDYYNANHNILKNEHSCQFIRRKTHLQAVKHIDMHQFIIPVFNGD